MAVTGTLGKGPRPEVRRWLERFGADFSLGVSSNTDVLVVGAHGSGEDREKIRVARANGVSMLSEAKFRKRYGI